MAQKLFISKDVPIASKPNLALSLRSIRNKQIWNHHHTHFPLLTPRCQHVFFQTGMRCIQRVYYGHLCTRHWLDIWGICVLLSSNMKKQKQPFSIFTNIERKKASILFEYTGIWFINNDPLPEWLHHPNVWLIHPHYVLDARGQYSGIGRYLQHCSCMKKDKFIQTTHSIQQMDCLANCTLLMHKDYPSPVVLALKDMKAGEELICHV